MTHKAAAAKLFEARDENERMRAWLDANPAMTVRDWKGKGFTEFSPFDPHYVAPGEKPFDKLTKRELAEMRALATSTKARFMPKNYRQAAARDPELVWDEARREYQLRSPPPSKSETDDQPRTGGGSGISMPTPRSTRTGGTGQ